MKRFIGYIDPEDKSLKVRRLPHVLPENVQKKFGPFTANNIQAATILCLYRLTDFLTRR